MRDPIDVLKIVELIFDNPCKFFVISVQYEEPIFYFNLMDGLDLMVVPTTGGKFAILNFAEFVPV